MNGVGSRSVLFYFLFPTQHARALIYLPISYEFPCSALAVDPGQLLSKTFHGEPTPHAGGGCAIKSSPATFVCPASRTSSLLHV